VTAKVMDREWNAGAYDRLSGAQRRWGLKVLERVAARGDETVLDAGCGSGRVTAELLRRLSSGRVVALDLSENMLRLARMHLAGEPRVSFVCADVQQLPFRERFDGIFSTATFHWAKDHPRTFRELFTALKPGGWLVAQCGGGPNLARLRERATRLTQTPRFAGFFRHWVDPWTYAGAEVTAERLRDAGFAEVKTWTEPAEFSLPDASTFRDYLATVTLHRHVAAITDEAARNEFLDELARQASRDPEFHLDYWRLNLDAIKPS
jgi:trans-aconitate 2-methyltransferase